ncbi:MAG: hypothetical protein M3Z14_04695, partial [Candidatus Eremiobacteraeota bacterium]|nr:hypothetical protein [Candidatus Eremiobacteraeota bacterium]
MTLKSFLQRHWVIVLPLVFELTVFGAWVHPGLLLGGDFLRRSRGELLSFFPWPHAWNPAQQSGENNEVYLFAFPLFAVMGVLARIGFPWTVIERLVYFWPALVVAVVAPYALLLRLTRNRWGAASGAAIFCINGFTIMALERGAVPSMIAVALLCFIVLLGIQFVERPSARLGFWYAAILCITLMYDLRYVYFAIILS